MPADRRHQQVGRGNVHRHLLLRLASVTMTGNPQSEDPDGLRLELLGAARLHVAGAGVHALERRDAALLTLLVIEGPTSRAHAAALLWPESDERHANNSLRQRLFRLKRALGRDVIIGDRLLALAPDVSHDLADFAARLALDGSAGQGELLGTIDFTDSGDLCDWVDAAREQWRATRRQVIAESASRLEAEGRIAPALELAERLVLDDVNAEHAHRRVMRLHYLRGDRAAALGAFERCRAFLKRELRAEPGKETLELAAVVQRSDVLPASAPSPRLVTLMRPPVLVGRESEWRAIQEAWAQARMVLLSGEPGMGKSRLVNDLAAKREGACTSGARPGDANVPYAMLTRVLRTLLQRFGKPSQGWVLEEMARVLPELGSAPASQLQPLRLHDAFNAAVQHCANSGLGLLMVDDMQFADAASLEWLLRWMDQLGPEGPRLLVAGRSNELPSALIQWSQAHVDDRLVEVSLQPLEPAGILQLLESLAVPGLRASDWVGPLARHTGGNPMYVLETITAHLSGSAGRVGQPRPELPIPAGIGPLIVRRLEQLSPSAHRLAQLAALAGPVFTVLLASRVLGVHPLDLSAAWRELEAAQVLRDGAMAHDLITEATAKSIPAPIANQLHREIAAAAESLKELPAHVAQHWFEAGEWAHAGAAFMRAAEVARATSQRKLEGELAAQAAECFDRCGDLANRFDARVRQHLTTRYTLRLDLQVENARQLLSLASTPEQRGVALEAYAAVLVEEFRHDDVAAAAREARLIAARTGDTTLELTAARTECRALGWTKRGPEALQLVQRYLPLARERLGDEAGVRAIAEFGCALMTCDRFDEAAALFEDALQAAVALENWGLCQECHRHMAWIHDYRGDIVKSVESYESSESLAQRIGAEKVPASISRSIFARRLKELGRFAEALALLEDVYDEQRNGAGVAVVAVTEADLAGLYLWFGQPARAMSVLRAPAHDAPPFMQRTYRFATAQIGSWQGRKPLAQLQEALDWANRESGPFYRFAIECELARLLPPDEGAALALHSMACSQAIGLELSTWPLKAVAADALRRAGRVNEAVELTHQCVEYFEARPPFVLYPPEYWWIAHQVFAAASEQFAAERALQKAVDWIRRTALPNVPEAFSDSFLHRNPVNRAVFAAAGQL